MERLSSPVEEALHYSSRPISIAKFKEQCIQKVDINDLMPLPGVAQNDESIEGLASALGVDEDTIHDLQEVCDISNLEVLFSV